VDSRKDTEASFPQSSRCISGDCLVQFVPQIHQVNPGALPECLSIQNPQDSLALRGINRRASGKQVSQGAGKWARIARHGRGTECSSLSHGYLRLGENQGTEHDCHEKHNDGDGNLKERVGIVVKHGWNLG
jgi:hypothetical protein